MKIVTAAQMREIDRAAIEQRGVPGAELMERAGIAVVDALLERFRPRRVLIVCGKGNNAGDGFVCARLLAEKGIDAVCALLGAEAELAGDALGHYRNVPASVERARIQRAPELQVYLESCDLIIDALLGTGIQGAPRGIFAEAIVTIEQSGLPVVAVDIPSGLPADGEAPEGACITAELTVTMGLPKIGLVTFPGADYAGELIVADIGFPAELLEDARITLNLSDADLIAAKLPPRPRNSHKGAFGKTLIIAGSLGMSGACILAAEGALRSGAGLVFAALPEKLLPIFAARVVEALSIPMPSSDGRRFDAGALLDLLQATGDKDAVALGPGMGQHPGTQQLIRECVVKLNQALVLDADGLNALAGHLDVLKRREFPTILTPHPGEMARLLNCSASAVQNERIDVARRFAREYGVVLVLKGARTVIAEPGGAVYINPTGNSGLAKGGSGDVLTGLLAGLLAQGLSATDAALVGVWIHGLAGDLAAEKYGERAALPRDVLECVSAAFELVEKRGMDCMDCLDGMDEVDGVDR